ncbi:U3 small nucleolar ribonucleoprotein subunit [Penicillium hispanicum]|uniref:U3 small nucleolar ribonucleoprotein subunit n=1 Tax=Penicillium hispanicum TaxID=1080232 RepID=UPI00254204E1|nr:U3 small nucleolar ribonucleoprotein subunit [Penicillium hispanicum]KAJ5591645.1 U3 small nucleolar ribonucleoprotein subunit [Penicillium hispanicum]
MGRDLKHHEKKLLKKHNFLVYKSDGGHREHAVRQRYHLQDPMDYRKYNSICGSLRHLAHQLTQLEPEDPVRRKLETEVLDKMWRMGILKKNREQGAALSNVEREVTVSAFCRRRLAVFMVRNGFVQGGNIQSAASLIEQGHVRVQKEVVTDPAYLIPRNLEDYVTWVDGSKIKMATKEYSGQRDDFDLLQA